MDSELSPPCKSKFRVQIFNPHLSYFKLVSCVCYLPLCSATKICGSDPLSSALRDGFRHFLTNSPNWRQPCHWCCLQLRLFESTPACSFGFWNVMFELSQVCSNKQCLPWLQKDERIPISPPYLSRCKSFFSSVCQLHLQSFSLSLFSCLETFYWKQQFQSDSPCFPGSILCGVFLAPAALCCDTRSTAGELFQLPKHYWRGSHWDLSCKEGKVSPTTITMQMQWFIGLKCAFVVLCSCCASAAAAATVSYAIFLHLHSWKRHVLEWFWVWSFQPMYN